jgi:hypothetical protein
VTRIFFVLALLSLLLLAVNLVLGLSIGDLHGVMSRYVEAQRAVARLEQQLQTSPEQLQQAMLIRDRAAEELQPIRARYGWHMLLGIAAGLVTILVNSITVTYFVGTSRWCREVVEAYRLSTDYVQRSQKIKRRSFPWALSSMLVVLALVALGGASDPAANWHNAHRFVTWHLVAAVCGWLFIAVSFWFQMGHIASNYQVIQEIMFQVERVQHELRQQAENAANDSTVAGSNSTSPGAIVG